MCSRTDPPLWGLLARFSDGPKDRCRSIAGHSLPAKPRDEGACLGKLFFVIRRIWRIATIAHRFKRHIDLAERGLSHGGVPPPLGEID
jgi:hypothetical protein